MFLGMKIGINISLKQLVRHMFSGRLFALKMVNKHYLNDCRRLEAILREKKLLT